MRLAYALAALGAACSFDHAGLQPAGGDGGLNDAQIADAGPDAPIDGCAPLPVELCNGADDTCDGAIDEGFDLTTPCDGPDTDLCADDIPVCDATGLGTTCINPSPDDDVESCICSDDDCDGTIDEGFAGLGNACDGPDTDLCTEGVIVCNLAGTGVECNDSSGSTDEVCNGLDDDCDGTPDDGLPMFTDAMRNTNPVCATSFIDLGNITGDNNTTVPPPFPFTVTATGSTEAFYKVRITETLIGFGLVPRAFATLEVPDGTNFNLHLVCGSCAGATLDSSTLGPGLDETVSVTRTDMFGDSSYDVFFRIDYIAPATIMCGTWTLTVTGNATSGSSGICNPP